MPPEHHSSNEHPATPANGGPAIPANAHPSTAANAASAIPVNNILVMAADEGPATSPTADFAILTIDLA